MAALFSGKKEETMIDYELCIGRIRALAQVIRENEQDKNNHLEAYAQMCRPNEKEELRS